MEGAAENDRQVLPDYLSSGLQIVFIGTAVGDTSAAKKHYYSRPNNAFWRCLHEADLVPIRIRPEDDHRIIDFGIGLTDLAKEVHNGSDALLARQDLTRGTDALLGKMQRLAPSIVCFNGKKAYRAFTGRSAASFGSMTEKIDGAMVFVVPSTSGRVAEHTKFDGRNRLEWFQMLAEVSKRSTGERTLELAQPTRVNRAAPRKEGNMHERIPLQDELRDILRENANRWMTSGELAEEVNRRGRYSKHDGSKMKSSQVAARVRRKKYRDLFEIDASFRIRLRLA